jgi:putative Holliday junction resolvase
MSASESKKVPGRVLGLDFGTKRIGLALSDDLRITVRPLHTWNRQAWNEDVAHIRGLVDAWDVTTIVVGVPYGLDGSITEATQRALGFIDRLGDALGCAIVPWDETLSSFEADRRMQDARVRNPKVHRDAFAAAVITEDFIGHGATT